MINVGASVNVTVSATDSICDNNVQDEHPWDPEYVCHTLRLTPSISGTLTVTMTPADSGTEASGLEAEASSGDLNWDFSSSASHSISISVTAGDTVLVNPELLWQQANAQAYTITTSEPGQTCSPADCDDGNVCNGTEGCTNGACSPGTPLNCNDANVCTADSCDTATGCAHAPVANGTSCADGNVCNGAETCQNGTCAGGTPLNCNDSNVCTTDSCNASTGCAQHAGGELARRVAMATCATASRHVRVVAARQAPR